MNVVPGPVTAPRRRAKSFGATAANQEEVRRVRNGARLDPTRGQNRFGAHSPSKTGVNALIAHALRPRHAILPTLQPGPLNQEEVHGVKRYSRHDTDASADEARRQE